MGNLALNINRNTAVLRLAFATLVMLALGWIAFGHFKVVASNSGSGTTGGDPGRGASLFNKRCGGCHVLDADKDGPRLRGVFGRKAGSVPNFEYSDGLKKSGVTWDEQSLDQWLADPDKFIADNGMDFQLEKADERADIIAYLKTLSTKP